MKLKLVIATLNILLVTIINAQTLKSPAQFLGYQLGSKFTWHYNIVGYAKHIAAAMPTQAIWQPYGATNEGRELGVLIISSADNINNLETIRRNNIAITTGDNISKNAPVIIWLSYNVHGNEPVSSEAFLKTVYTLISSTNAKTANWLQNAVIILDPCLNPDGRDRYVNWYTSVAGYTPNASNVAREHVEPWPQGRSNHYNFDLNRDWAWQTQIETKTRIALYNTWMPHVHADYHEQGYNEPYYFAPAAEPMHEVITPFQKELQTTIGKKNAATFDANGWLYFTKERFDLFYPAYGDTWPTYNGSVGMTYEQGGIRAGISIRTNDGDTLNLIDRILHHEATGLNTIDVAVAEKQKILTAFSNYFKNALTGSKNEFKYYVVKNDGTNNIDKLTALLTQNNITFYHTTATTTQGYNYFNNKLETFSIANNDIVINAAQPASNMLKVLFERNSKLTDSLTYDITSWCIPFAYGAKTYGVNNIAPIKNNITNTTNNAQINTNAYALLIPWAGGKVATLLSHLIQAGIKVRYNENDFVYNKTTYPKGTLIITKAANNKNVFSNIQNIINNKNLFVNFTSVTSGYVDKGLDLGSSTVHPIQTPTIALLSGRSTSSLSMGEVWHYFDKDLAYPITLINAEDLRKTTLQNFNTLILADGDYDFITKNSFVKDWVAAGNKLIALEGVVSQLAAAEWGGIKLKEPKKDEDKKDVDYNLLKIYEQRERDDAVNNNPGSVYKLSIDNTHPLAFGYPNFYYTLKQDAKVYDYLKTGWNIGYIKKDNYTSGFVGNKTKQLLKDGTLIGMVNEGRGNIIFFADDVLFRNFWENGKLFMANAVFFAGQ